MGLSNGTGATNGHGSSLAAKYDIPSHFVGGNALDVAPPSNVKDFVAAHGGHSVITSVRPISVLGGAVKTAPPHSEISYTTDGLTVRI